ncbi:ChrR-like anti-ECFsigma factor [Breoghania corrubedonensis]|uniref:ChrR-like anti-ECFsigma factor n=1 Tax=Breoghania corrubedonensis TaxID=665038 RepID=A0A2T5US64_9HYPH|nr:ChrR family anti-sigma-E factor [Breoghania corrubedonensis]PTW54333.1 ChrR-like anti-ECFsigma factor [Breoghania corrubedonensis]
MTILHHLDQTTLLRYASGDLDEAFSVVVAAHLAMCDECRRELRIAEDIGGRLLEESEMATVSDGAFSRIMCRIDEAEASGETILAAPPIALRGGKQDVPSTLQRYIGTRLADISWKTVAPGVRRHKIALSTPTRSALYMLKIEPGKAVPEHGHGGTEMTLILSGAYRDALGRFGPGDLADLDEHVEHQPRVEPGEPCVCLVATEAPTRFKGIFSRLLQPLVGI